MLDAQDEQTMASSAISQPNPPGSGRKIAFSFIWALRVPELVCLFSEPVVFSPNS